MSDSHDEMMFAGWAMQEMDDAERRGRGDGEDGCCSGDTVVGCLWLLGILLICGTCGRLLG